jgi:hypothetical protein
MVDDLVSFYIHYVDCVGFRIEHSVHSNLISDKPTRQVLIVQMIDILSRNQHELTAQPFDAINGTGASRVSRRAGLGLQHLLMRLGQRVNIEGTLAIGDFTAKYGSFLGARRRGKNYCKRYDHGQTSELIHWTSM